MILHQAGEGGIAAAFGLGPAGAVLWTASCSQARCANPAGSHPDARATFHCKKVTIWELSEMAERAGFEPAVPLGTRAFQARSFGHSDTSP